MVSKIKPQRGFLFDDTPRGILEALLVAGSITVALSAAPVFVIALGALGYMLKAEDKTRRKKLNQYGNYLKRRKYITLQQVSKNQVRISLTPSGEQRALGARARRLLGTPVNRPRTWDFKWRLILFDIAAEERAKRNAFREFIRRIGAVMLQKSVWIHPFDCAEHIELLREYFSLSESELRLVVAERVGEDRLLRRHFNL
ncbi:hypothetical protein A3A39_01100 [Candidatus Kaiserbacteria bacterium RIFCSPLOWO2_01_FULL_54_13]|uniref:Transcriptional repressor PaaX-like central Cas2-like domain-containing protein n=1 Tax=Candidatus Kaiserbacteria bacterium RIFCSPLOWO2_01_FULL_54_13 TaxID=1798512 RepID=A0A1F6F278_9BACT|nr:MAG: hypothetical protein A3A39_01100 [Candidatus Kaiserbacteria bacterium RIFCSPLOWO2_01_FULL_54_13]